MKHATAVFTRFLIPGFLLFAVLAAEAFAGPNIIAIGNYDSLPFRRAEGRDSVSGREVIYEFTDPEFDFGRIIVRSDQPLSVVRRDLFVGFSGQGLVIDTMGGSGGRTGSIRPTEVEVWLKVRGKIRPNRRYEWEVLGGGEQEIQGGVPALIPAYWADGQSMASEVTIREPQIEETDRIQRMLRPHGVVEIGSFKEQTGAAWVVLFPSNYGRYFLLQQFVFREVEEADEVARAGTMPTPVRYVPIRNALEDRISEVLVRGADALRAQRTPENFWSGPDPEGHVAITATVIAALAEQNPDRSSLEPSMRWLAQQEPPAGQTWATNTVAARLYALSRFGGLRDYHREIHRDIQTLVEAQLEDGGWSLGRGATGGGRGGRGGEAMAANSDHDNSFAVVYAMREARLAGAEIDRGVWRRSLKYWTDAQSYDGGFGNRLERFGGLSQISTTAYTATGVAGLIAALDMAAGIGERSCTRYAGSTEQIRAINRAVEWLNKTYGEPFMVVGAFVPNLDPYLESDRLQSLGVVSGISQFNEKNHFVESGNDLMQHYDNVTGMFGVRGPNNNWAQAPNVPRTAAALTILGGGAAPTVCQRMIVGDDDRGTAQLSGDIPHLVRYLSVARGRQFNWRRTAIDQPIREIARVPILVLNVVGPFEWTEEEWGKLRDYCLSGGTLVIDVLADRDGLRDAVRSGVRRAFPEYELAELPKDHPLFSMEEKISNRPSMLAMGNGFRDFLFLPEESWSCQFHLYQVQERPDVFSFMNNLLSYATDREEPRSSFAPSPYAVGSVAAHHLRAAHLELGGSRPTYPNLIDTLSRLMQDNYRLALEAVDDFSAADFVWVTIAGDRKLTDVESGRLKQALTSGAFVMIDVAGGDSDVDETIRGMLPGLGDGLAVETMRRSAPMYTGEIAGTQGFDVIQVNLRRALHTRFAKSGRADLYDLRRGDKIVGAYSAHDLSSGIVYHQFPGCRGVAPDHAREIAMNACLIACGKKIAAAK